MAANTGHDAAPAAPAAAERVDQTAEETALLAVMDELCTAHSPAGCEREIDAVLLRWLKGPASRVWQNPAGNVIALFNGRAHDRPLLLNAHKDEIGLVVKRVDEDGRMRVRPIGSAHPWKYGEGPVDLLADDGEVVPAALCFGSTHVSEETPLHKVKSGRQALTWDMAYVDAKLSREALAGRGVHAGIKLALDRARKRPRLLGEYVCAHALDDKGGVAILLRLALRFSDVPPPQDVYVVFSSMEEIGGGAAVYAAHQLPADAMLRIEIVPAMPEYGVKGDARPVLIHMDATHVYDEALTWRAALLAAGLGLEVQHAVLSSFGSDPGLARKGGGIPRAALIGFAADNSHGYEIAHLGGLVNSLALVEAFVRDWT